MDTIMQIKIVATNHSIFDGLYDVHMILAANPVPKRLVYGLSEHNIMVLFDRYLPQNAVQIALTEWRNANPDKWSRYCMNEFQHQPMYPNPMMKQMATFEMYRQRAANVNAHHSQTTVNFV